MTNLEFLGGNRSNKYLHLFGGPLVETDDAALDEGVVGSGDVPIQPANGDVSTNSETEPGCPDPTICGQPVT